MERQILNNKIGIQILLIIAGLMFFTLGLLSCTLQASYNYFNTYNASFYGDYNATVDYIIGAGMVLMGLLLIIISSIKINSYSLMKKSTTTAETHNKPTMTRPVAVTTEFDKIRNKIASLRQMKNEGLINETEYEEMKSSVIKNAGGVL